jgi:DNA protecting protein DprA
MCEIREVQAIYSFMKVGGIGIIRTNKELASYAEQMGSMWGLENWLLSALTPKQKEEFHSKYERVEGLQYESNDVLFNTILDHSYPVSLKNLLKMSTPPVLSMIGNVGLLRNKKIGFSGSRKVSDKGIEITRDCVDQLSHISNVSIVSGYAQGVDKEAHYTALKSGGSTIIVLPNGIKAFYVRKELREVWDWNRVLVISEYLPEDVWTVTRAMNRNNTIIGLSDAMVVVEAGLTGGSLDAGNKTLKDHKPLFVPRYAEYPTSALGNPLLLEKGAHSISRNRLTQRANIQPFEMLVNE